jgi:hypothetical protein
MFKIIKKGIAFVLAALSLVALSGCSAFDKNAALRLYNDAISYFGEKPLTADDMLTGKRAFGEDSYVGVYSADYEGFEKTEYLFGGTCVERKGGGKVDIICDMTAKKGEGELLLVCGNGGPKVLAAADGRYAQTFCIQEKSWYVGFRGRDFTGTLKLFVTDRDGSGSE